jgi:hypothetical protein
LPKEVRSIIKLKIKGKTRECEKESGKMEGETQNK